MRRTLAAILIAVAATAAAFTFSAAPGVPSCQEDEVVVGQGNFTAGRWDTYRCVNVGEVN